MIVSYKPHIGDMIVAVQEVWSYVEYDCNCREMSVTVEYERDCQSGGLGW